MKPKTANLVQAPGAGRPAWFDAFLADRGTRKPSRHTVAAYCADFDAIARILVTRRAAESSVHLNEIADEPLGTAFAAYAEKHKAATVRRCWSSWNVLCTYLLTTGRISKNPMIKVGRPKIEKTLPKSLPARAIQKLIAELSVVSVPQNSFDWPERDRATILLGLLTGLRTEELIQANVEDIRRAEGWAVIEVRGKGRKDRRVPVEQCLVDVIDGYLESRLSRFPPPTAQRLADAKSYEWPPLTPLLVGIDANRMTRGTLQYRVKRAFHLAGIDDDRARGALVHSLRHTYATQLAISDVSVYTLMNLLGHESMTTSQRYVTAAGSETRRAAASNPIYGML